MPETPTLHRRIGLWGTRIVLLGALAFALVGLFGGWGYLLGRELPPSPCAASAASIDSDADTGVRP